MHVPTFLLALHDFRPIFNSPLNFVFYVPVWKNIFVSLNQYLQTKVSTIYMNLFLLILFIKHSSIYEQETPAQDNGNDW